MPAYTWTCIACDASNAPESEQCDQCGCPANASGSEAELIRNGANLAPLFSLPHAQLTIGRLSTGSIFKLWFLGTSAAHLVYGVGIGVAALFGSNTVRWGSEPITGIWGLLLALGIAIFSTVVCSVFFGACSLIPLYFYSKKWPIRLTARRVTVRQKP